MADQERHASAAANTNADEPGSRSPGLEIRKVALDALHLDPANARLHGVGNLEAIKASLLRFGQAEPLVVHKATGRVIGGNGRLVAMRELGWTTCDVVELTMTELQATALAIALNRTAELAEWDHETLARLLTQLRAADDLQGIGFSNDDIDELLSDLGGEGSPQDIDDPGPGEPPTQPVSRPGDLWLLGDHRLLCGDATSASDIARLMNGAQASLLSTDPPYCVDYTGANRPVHNGKPSGKDWSAVYREIDIEDLGDFLRASLEAQLPHVEAHAPFYVWHAHVQQHVLAEVLAERDILFHQVIVWVKPTAVFGHSYYQWRHEPCAFGWRKGNRPKHGMAQMNTVWEVDWEGKQRIVGNEHPTQKPLRLFEIPMELHTRPGDICLEPFSGSGTQILAAERLGRRCFALDLSPAFVDVAVRRWERATGGEATLEGTGEHFSVLASKRLTEATDEREESA